MALLTDSRDPLDLVRTLSWPRFEVWSTVRLLALSGRLDTPRAAYAASEPVGSRSWGGLPLGELGEQIDRDQRSRLSVARSAIEVLDALAEPLWALESLWATFVEAERFSTRAAFGLPEEPEVSQAERYVVALGELMAVLPKDGQKRLEELVDGRPHVVSGAVIEARCVDMDLARSTAERALMTLCDDVGPCLDQLGIAKVLAILIGNHRAVTARGGPRVPPPWITELSLGVE